MHFEILTEDKSGKKILDTVVPRIIGTAHTFKVIGYSGIGAIPRNMKTSRDVNKRVLLGQLRKMLVAYGKTFASYKNYSAVVIVVCDLDEKCLEEFRSELLTVLDSVAKKPETRFCIAIEEGEAWLLGDIPAIKKAFPKAKNDVLAEYVNDAICGTWEALADAIYPGGSKELKPKGYPEIGIEKSGWAGKIAPEMDIENNLSPSFVYFRDKMRELAKNSGGRA